MESSMVSFAGSPALIGSAGGMTRTATTVVASIAEALERKKIPTTIAERILFIIGHYSDTFIKGVEVSGKLGVESKSLSVTA
jgi:hypothetical protein